MREDYDERYAIYIHKARRLQALEEQAAQFGISTSPEIKVEIIELRAACDAEVIALQNRVSNTVAAGLGDVGRYQSLSNEIKQLKELLTEQIKWVEKELTAKIDRVNWIIGITVTIIVVASLIALAFYIGSTFGRR